MPFDLGFNFRSTAGYVTDPAYGVPVLGESYPHTYTNANGDSINAGWTDVTNFVVANRSATNDPRIAGVNFQNTQDATDTFQVDLASGSNPGAGAYTIDIAWGDHSVFMRGSYILYDNTTSLISSGTQALNNGQYIDATGALVTATTTWTGATASKTFATTTAKLTSTGAHLGGYSGFPVLAHFRLTLQAGGGGQSVVPVLMAQYRQRGA